jgi:uncharacterized membrane protein
MVIPSVQAIKAETDQALRRANNPRKVILAYAGITVLLSALLTVANALLSDRIADTGGLANFGIRSILSTAQSILPMIQSVALLCLEFGYLHAILRISRGQYAYHTDLKVGFHRFGAVIRLTMWQYFLIFSVTMMLFYLSMQIFILTPWADPLLDLLTPLVTEAGANAAALMDEAMMDQALQLMVPMLVIYGIVCCVVLIPILYGFRMAIYVLLDDPNGRAFAALRTSKQMMRRNKFRLFKLDLSFWWYYGLVALATAISYGDVILPMLGITLPGSAELWYFVCMAGYFAILFAANYFLRSRVEVSYALVYDCVKPEEKQDNGVVLGNIFQM